MPFGGRLSRDSGSANTGRAALPVALPAATGVSASSSSAKSIFVCSMSTRATFTRTRPASWNTTPVRSPISAWRVGSKWK